VVFRVFTKKNNLTVTASSLQLLASFVGKHCGAGWREDGLAEPVLDEIAKTWKKSGGGMIVEDAQELSLALLLRGIEERMSGGRLVSEDSKSSKPFAALHLSGKTAGRERAASDELDTGARSIAVEGGQSVSETAESVLAPDDVPADPRRFIKVVSAFNQPRLVYNPQRRQFEQSPASPSLFPLQRQKAALSRDRYHVIHQRLLRNEAFQTSTSELFGRQSNRSLKLTSIANLQGRSGSSHLLLGLLSPTPTGDLALTDPTGTISLDLRYAKAVPEGGVWFTPGMIVLIDGIYDEEETVSGSGLANASGIGGTIGGKFVGFSIGGPPCERREVSLGLSGPNIGDKAAAQGFGWTDFLGVGADRISGPGMRKIEDQYLQKTRPGESNNIRGQIVIMSESGPFQDEAGTQQSSGLIPGFARTSDSCCLYTYWEFRIAGSDWRAGNRR
jgi:DNA polymerase epsilon subunit 2